jgi:hypothetical protein
MDKVLSLLSGRRNLVLVEIGSTRTRGNWEGDGYSTPFFAWIAENSDSDFYTVDLHSKVTQLSKDICAEYGLGISGNSRVRFITRDGIEFAKDWPKSGLKIDLLYLDAWGWNESDAKWSEECHLEATDILFSSIKSKGIIMIDDILDYKNWTGKGRLAIPFLLERGCKIIYLGRQVILQRG